MLHMSLLWLEEPCPQGSGCNTLRRYGFREEMRIFLPELVFMFPASSHPALRSQYALQQIADFHQSRSHPKVLEKLAQPSIS
ncbi:hypothetical protein Tco_0394976 [Tanacetum coccineum]